MINRNDPEPLLQLASSLSDTSSTRAVALNTTPWICSSTEASGQSSPSEETTLIIASLIFTNRWVTEPPCSPLHLIYRWPSFSLHVHGKKNTISSTAAKKKTKQVKRFEWGRATRMFPPTSSTAWFSRISSLAILTSYLQLAEAQTLKKISEVRFYLILSCPTSH